MSSRKFLMRNKTLSEKRYMTRYKSKKGSISLFLCVILSAIMLVESVFYYASWIRNAEADLQRCMSLQAYHALASYNEKLFDWYGLYAIQSDYRSTSILEECFPYTEYMDSSVELSQHLDSDYFYTGAINYIKVRAPIMLVSEILQTFQSASAVIQESGMQESMDENQAANTYLTQIFSEENDLASILSTAASVIETIDITGSMTKITSLIDTYKMMMEQKATLALQGDMSSAEFGDFTDPMALEKLLSSVNGFLDINLPDVAEAFLLNEYIVACFDSQLSNQATGIGFLKSKGEINFLNNPFSDLHEKNQFDLEYIYSGNENQAKSYATASIYSIRTIINIAEILLDQNEMQNILSIATTLSTIIAALSLGSVVIEANILQYVIVLIKGFLGGMTDTNRLLNGETFPLFENPRLHDKQEKLLMMNYREYFRIFLLFVSKEDKLERCLSLIKRDCGSDLPAKIQIKTNFLKQSFRIEKEFALYEKEE